MFFATLILLGVMALFALFIGLRTWFAQMHQMNKRIENTCRGCSGLHPYER